MPNQMQPPMWSPGINRSQQIAHGLLAYFPIWEGDGSTAMDVAGDNTGAITGHTWGNSVVGHSLNIAGSGKIALPQIYTTPTELSVMVHATLADTNNAKYLVDSSNGVSGIAIRTNINDNFDAFVRRSIGDLSIIDSVGAFVVGVPFMLTMVMTPTDLTLYQDGAWLGVNSDSFGSLLQGDPEVIAADYAGNNAITGQIHQAAFWDRALSVNEVVYLHNMGEHAITTRARRQVVSAGLTSSRYYYHHHLLGGAA